MFQYTQSEAIERRDYKKRVLPVANNPLVRSRPLGLSGHRLLQPTTEQLILDLIAVFNYKLEGSCKY